MLCVDILAILHLNLQFGHWMSSDLRWLEFSDLLFNDWALVHANLLIYLLGWFRVGFFFPSAVVNLHQQFQINPLWYLFFSSSFDLDYDFQRDYYDRYV